MTVEVLRSVLAWCAVINYALLMLWFLVFSLGHDRVRRLHGRWFTLSTQQFDATHYQTMAFFKLCIFLFNLVPYLALRIVV